MYIHVICISSIHVRNVKKVPLDTQPAVRSRPQREKHTHSHSLQKNKTSRKAALLYYYFVKYLEELNMMLMISTLPTLLIMAFTITAHASLGKDWFTGESLETYNGAVPRTTCPKGYYRPSGGTDLMSVTALRVDGCVQCPRGKYGNTEGETDALCSGSCPLGKYSDRTGITSVFDCKNCPSGRYGASIGLQSKSCTAACAAGKWSPEGSTSSASCKVCEFNLSGKLGGCTQDMTPHEPLY